MFTPSPHPMDDLAAHERWWQDNLDTNEVTLRGWLEGSDPASRDAVARIAVDAKASTVLEVGPGLYIDYARHWRTMPGVQYTALERTPKLVQRGLDMGIPVVTGSIERIPFVDGSFDVAYCRHVVEHLPSYELAIAELVRVSRGTAVVVFFALDTVSVLPTIRYDTVAEAPRTYHNIYSQKAITAWITTRGWTCAWERPGTDWVLTIWK